MTPKAVTNERWRHSVKQAIAKKEFLALRDHEDKKEIW